MTSRRSSEPEKRANKRIFFKLDTVCLFVKQTKPLSLPRQEHIACKHAAGKQAVRSRYEFFFSSKDDVFPFYKTTPAWRDSISLI
jgi:hypothetical protein